METRRLIPLIAMFSVLVMFIWSYATGSWQYSWLAVFAGGIAMAAVSYFGKKNKDK